MDRCIIAAVRSGLKPVVCVNKTDLAERAAELHETLDPYEALGHRTIKTSVVTGEGVNELRGLLRDKTTVFTGLSGTGKSSLITAVQPGLDLRTSEVSSTGKHMGEGWHTTTQKTMLGLKAGGFVLDTPGVRQFGLSGLRRPQLASFFPEIDTLAFGCRFNNCAHLEGARVRCSGRKRERLGTGKPVSQLPIDSIHAAGVANLRTTLCSVEQRSYRMKTRERRHRR